MKTTALVLILAITATQNAYSITATDVFPGTEDWVVLKGERVRKGTIAASINNIKRLDTLLSKRGSEQEIRDIIKDQHSLSRGLYATDFLQMQPIMNWLRDPKRPGKIMVAVLALQACPELMTAQIRVALQEIVKSNHPMLRQEIKKLL